jgi:hypothetical protein
LRPLAKELLVIVTLLFVFLVLMILVRQRIFYLGFFVGQLRFSHWLVWVGAAYIAFAVPTIAVLKKRFPSRYMALFRSVFGTCLLFVDFASFVAQSAVRTLFPSTRPLAYALYV